MKTYIYTATDVQGNTVKNQRMNAEDVNDFLDKIHEKGLFCSDYREAKGSDKKSLHKFSTKELAYDCRQMSAMMTSGLTLVKTLDIMQKEQQKEANKLIYRDIYESVQKGTSFSDAIKSQDGAFPNFFISMVEAGESSGNLDMVMQKMEAQYTNDAKLTNKVKSAMMYPIILAVLCVAIVIIMFTFIMPTFKDLLTEEDMHGLTGALFAFSDGFKKFWWLILLIVIGLIFGIKYAMKVPDIRYKWDQAIIKIKPVGPLVVKVYTARFGSTLASLYSSGIPMVECLQKSSAILNNMYVTRKFETVIDEVKQGEALSTSIQRTGIFESMFVSIIYVGEESGALDTILTKSAAFYQEESDEAITRLVGLIEPVMIIFMGGAIGTVISGILPAIYNSMGNIA